MKASNDFTIYLPDGVYKGLWSAYTVDIFVEGESLPWSFHTEIGVKGINEPVLVTIKNFKVENFEEA